MGGDARVAIVREFGVSLSAIQRHKLNCRLSDIKTTLPGSSRIDVLANLACLLDDAGRAQFRAEQERKWGIVVAAIGKRKEVLEAIAQVQGPEVRDEDIWKHPEVQAFMARVSNALESHPEARAAVIAAMQTPLLRGES